MWWKSVVPPVLRNNRGQPRDRRRFPPFPLAPSLEGKIRSDSSPVPLCQGAPSHAYFPDVSADRLCDNTAHGQRPSEAILPPFSPATSPAETALKARVLPTSVQVQCQMPRKPLPMNENAIGAPENRDPASSHAAIPLIIGNPPRGTDVANPPLSVKSRSPVVEKPAPTPSSSHPPRIKRRTNGSGRRFTV